MDKFAERKKFTSCKLVAAAAVAMCLLGSAGFEANAAPAPQVVSAQKATLTISGTVKDSKGEPVIGANVMEKGTNRGIVTDLDGKFTLKVTPGATITVSYLGYKTQTLKAAPTMNVSLEEDNALLDEVVVVGFGTQKRANLTGAVATVDVSKAMDARPVGDVTKALQGAVPGLTITTGDGAINSAASIKIRGTGTLSNGQSSSPLIVVDGVPTDDITFVNPDDIAEISVLKDAASSAVYGTRAAFGVVLITTKSGQKGDRVSVKYSNNFGWSNATVLPDYGSVPEQIEALLQTNYRKGADPELFGMYLDKMLPYAKAWYEQNGGKKKGYSEMLPYQSMDNVGDFYQDPVTKATMYYADWDVKDIMYRTAPSQKHNVSLDGSSGNTTYRVSFGYDKREGLMSFVDNSVKRYNASANLSTQIFSWLKAGAQVNYSQKDYDGQNMWGRGGYTYFWRWGSFFGPYGYRKYDGDGKYYDAQPIADRKQSGEHEDIARNTRLQGWMEANPIKGLNIHADFTYDMMDINVRKSYLPIFGWNNWSNSSTAPSYLVQQKDTYAQQENTRQNVWTVNAYATYDFDVAEDNHFKVMVGGQADRKYYNYFSARKNVLSDNDKPYLGLATGGADGTSMTITNTITKHATAGFFGRINYDYKGIYLLEVNGRYDGSSSFPANDQWAFFPSASVGYRFSEEAYFEKAKQYVSNAKFRASYGHIGNEAIGDYMFLEKISKLDTRYTSWVNAGGTFLSMLNTPSMVSSTLSWERIATTDIGLDLGFLNNRLNVTFDWFQRDTKDMLAPGMTLPATLGASAPYANSGSLRTRGWELGISWNHRFGDVDVFASANIYDGKTKVTEYNNPNKLINQFYSGMEYGEIWGFETDRYFEESDFTGKNADGSWIYAPGVADQTGLQQGTFVYGPGDIKFKDLDGNGVINGGDPTMKDAEGNLIPVGTVRNHGDLKKIGNATPRYEYSFRLGAAWKGIDVDLFFQGVGKRDMWYVNAFTMPFSRGADASYAHQNSYNKMIFDDARNIIGYEINQNNDYPCMYDGMAGAGAVSGLSQGRYNFYPQSKYLLNMAYLRLKTVTIGYTLPQEITKKALIQKARIYFTAENPCLIYNGLGKNPIDPEIGSTWTTSKAYNNGTFGRSDPMMRTYSFGLQVTF